MAKKSGKSGGGSPTAGKGSSGSASPTPPAAKNSGCLVTILKSPLYFALVLIILVVIFGKPTGKTDGSSNDATVTAQGPSKLEKLAALPKKVATKAKELTRKTAHWLDHAGDLYTTPPSNVPKPVPVPVMKLVGPMTLTIAVNKAGWTAIPDMPDDRYDVSCDYAGSSLQIQVDGITYEYSAGKLWRFAGVHKIEWKTPLKGTKWSYRVPPDAPGNYPGIAIVHITIRPQ